MRYSFLKPFSRNLEIQTSYCDVIISRLRQRDSICVSCTTDGKNMKIRTYIIILVQKFFLTEEFLILKYWSSLWRYYSSPSESPYRSVFDLSTTNCIRFISSVSFWDHFNPTVMLCTRYANLGLFDPILAIMTSELALKSQNLWNLYLQLYIFASKFL